MAQEAVDRLAGRGGADPSRETPDRGRERAGGGRSGTWGNKALWCVGLGLLANAAALVYSRAAGGGDLGIDAQAMAQMVNAPSDRMLGAKGIYMMPAQLGPTSWGVYLLDVDAGTICVYRANPDTLRFRLMAVRDFRYDRYLNDFNNEGLTPKDVQKLVNQQRQREQLEGKTGDKAPDGPPATAPGGGEMRNGGG